MANPVSQGCLLEPSDLVEDADGRAAIRYLGMQPEVATGETTSFPSTISALTDDAPHVQGAWSRFAPVACAAGIASTAAAAAITKQTLTRGRGPQNLTTRA
jgi:hypothetical protein